MHQDRRTSAALFALPLVVPRSTEYAELGVPPAATAEEIRAAAARRDVRMRARGAGDKEIAAAHAVNLENAQARADYDACHPPLALLRLEPTWSALFDEREAGLAVLRREIEAFLSAAGESVFRPTDLDRTDFRGDFAHHRILDDAVVE
ncbi:hypothetical protein [Catenulispora pinisilvae]|uniref:hypothetical protein n=1 Tax=Catenulispora pinisilvae TaxID=2705253 RepID=UPI001891022D|nr:hypothetical protein [Catenulispora pinisilvae]